MNPPDFATFAAEHFGGDLDRAFETIARYQKPYEANPMSVYVTSKVYSNWWAAALARKLPHGMVVNAVSPGSVPDTSFARHQGFFMKHIMMPMLNKFGGLMGMAWSRRDAANRYLAAGEFDADTTGHFFCSPVGKFIGKMELQTGDVFLNRELQEAGWRTIVNLSGVDYPAEAMQKRQATAGV